MAANPELIRNIRAQWRPDRMIAAAAICAILSVVAGLAMYRQYQSDQVRWGRELLGLTVVAQGIVLIVGGGFAALGAISREKELNTFDFQRATRLTPLELTLGKLLGAPAFMYFIALCLVPTALVGAVAGFAAVPFVLAGYAVLVLGAIAIHALALLVSLLIERGAAGTGAILVLLGLWLGQAVSGVTGFALSLHSLSPLIARTVMEQTWWALEPPVQDSADFFARPTLTDVVFGHPVHHVGVVIVLYVVFTAWFVLAVARNIKRDPAVYEIFTPAQALGMALWINLIMVGFFRWSRFAPFNAEGAFLGLNATLFVVLGLGMLRNRDTSRRLRVAVNRSRRWVAAVWPSPYVLGGLLLAGFVPVAILQVLSPRHDGEWDLGLAAFKVGLIAAWVTRDLLFLQWMNVQRGSRPLRRGILYLVVYYVCAGVALSTLRGWTFDPVGLATNGLLLPPTVLSLSLSSWTSGWAFWLGALAVQIAIGGLFAALHAAKLAELERVAEIS